MRAPKSPMSATPDPIAEHPAMRRILSTQRAWIDGGRVLAYRTAMELDLAKHHTDNTRKHLAQQWCSFVTPVLKAAWTHQAFKGSSECLQVFGGHGYVREWGIEQIVRDSRVTMIYEGTNEIQAIDLLVRKVLPDGGAGLFEFLDTLSQGLDLENVESSQLLDRINEIKNLTLALVKSSKTEQALAYWVADDYLRTIALILLEWAWLQIANARHAAAADEHSTRWTEPARALRNWVSPEFNMCTSVIKAQL